MIDFLFQAFRCGFLPYMVTAAQYLFLSLSVPTIIWYGLSFLLIIQCIPTIPTVEGTSVGLDTTATARKTRRHMIIYVGLLIMFSTDALTTVTRSSTAKRKRRTVGSIFHELGPYYTRRAYRMDAKTFWKLHKTIHKQLHYNNFPSSSSKKKWRNGARNGLITSPVRLSCAIRYFAGGSTYDIAVAHGVSVRQVYYSVWRVVDAIHNTKELNICFPNYEEQNKISLGFKAKSQAGFDNLVGCIDGMLLWMEKPQPSDCLVCGFGEKKFFCGRKKKFGLNMTGTVDDQRRFIDIDISHPGATSDYLAFATSSLHRKLEQGLLLSPGKYLFGDNAYVNTMYMVTPYRQGDVLEDNYNFYHSQLRINVECAFGMLVKRWAILRHPLPSAMGLNKITSLTMALCKLHNFLIDQRIERMTSTDMAHLRRGQNISLQQHEDDDVPNELLHGGEHFDDVGTNEIRRENYRRNRDATQNNERLPRDVLKDAVTNQGLVRPTPRNWA